jgi:hypothetical protein
MSFREAALAITINGSTTDFFKLFYRNSLEAALDWFIYPNILEFELPASFRFRTIYSDAEEFKILCHLVRPSLLPVKVRLVYSATSAVHIEATHIITNIFQESWPLATAR